VSELIDKVIDTQRTQIGKTKSQVLKTIKLFDIADFEVASLWPADLAEFANQVVEGEHRPAEHSPATTAYDMSHLSGCLNLARPNFAIPFDKRGVEEARETTTTPGITGKSKKEQDVPILVNWMR